MFCFVCVYAVIYRFVLKKKKKKLFATSQREMLIGRMRVCKLKQKHLTGMTVAAALFMLLIYFTQFFIIVFYWMNNNNNTNKSLILFFSSIFLFLKLWLYKHEEWLKKRIMRDGTYKFTNFIWHYFMHL